MEDKNLEICFSLQYITGKLSVKLIFSDCDGVGFSPVHDGRTPVTNDYN
jgi:hypothetical protein